MILIKKKIKIEKDSFENQISNFKLEMIQTTVMNRNWVEKNCY